MIFIENNIGLVRCIASDFQQILHYRKNVVNFYTISTFEQIE